MLQRIPISARLSLLLDMPSSPEKLIIQKITMEWLVELFKGESIAKAVLVLSMVAASGIFIGSLKFRGISLGIAGVLFSGLIFGHYHISIDPHVMEFAREFGLILFVYTIGMQVGPGFIASLKRQGLPLNIMASSIVLMGALLTIGLVYFAHIDMAAAVGLFAGATTNTPALGAAQQALKNLASYTDEMGKIPGLGYAVAYPFGILGIIIAMGLVRFLFRVNPATEATEFYKLNQTGAAKVITSNLEINNPNINGLAIKQIPGLLNSGVVISRIHRKGEINVATPESVLHIGDVVLAVGPKEKIDEISIVIGTHAELDLKSLPSHLTTKRVVVTCKDVLGKSLEELDYTQHTESQLPCVSRAEIEMTASPNFRLQFADTVMVVGEEKAIANTAKVLGNSPKQLTHPQIMPVFVGIALGVSFRKLSNSLSTHAGGR